MEYIETLKEFHKGTRIGSRINASVDGCWEWIGYKNSRGYGVFGPERAHRLIYRLLRRPIPDGLVIDHLCRNHGCVNPEHLEAVTVKENTLRGVGWAAINAAKTECPKGHLYTEANTLTSVKGRSCGTCGKAATDSWNAKAKELRKAHREQHPIVVKTHCPKGHPYDEVNTYVNKGSRHCRICAITRKREWRHARRGL